MEFCDLLMILKAIMIPNSISMKPILLLNVVAIPKSKFNESNSLKSSKMFGHLRGRRLGSSRTCVPDSAASKWQTRLLSTNHTQETASHSF